MSWKTNIINPDSLKPEPFKSNGAIKPAPACDSQILPPLTVCKLELTQPSASTNDSEKSQSSRCGLTTKLSDRRAASVARSENVQVVHHRQSQSWSAVRCSALVRARTRHYKPTLIKISRTGDKLRSRHFAPKEAQPAVIKLSQRSHTLKSNDPNRRQSKSSLCKPERTKVP